MERQCSTHLYDVQEIMTLCLAQHGRNFAKIPVPSLGAVRHEDKILNTLSIAQICNKDKSRTMDALRRLAPFLTDDECNDIYQEFQAFPQVRPRENLFLGKLVNDILARPFPKIPAEDAIEEMREALLEYDFVKENWHTFLQYFSELNVLHSKYEHRVPGNEEVLAKKGMSQRVEIASGAVEIARVAFLAQEMIKSLQNQSDRLQQVVPPAEAGKLLEKLEVVALALPKLVELSFHRTIAKKQISELELIKHVKIDHEEIDMLTDGDIEGYLTLNTQHLTLAREFLSQLYSVGGLIQELINVIRISSIPPTFSGQDEKWFYKYLEESRTCIQTTETRNFLALRDLIRRSRSIVR